MESPYPAASIVDVARGLFDTDPVYGLPVNVKSEVHPEYVRAVIELTARLTVEWNNDLDGEPYEDAARAIGLPYPTLEVF